MRASSRGGVAGAAGRAVTLLAFVLVGLSGLVSGTTAAMSARTLNPSNTFATKADWVPPTTSAAKVLNDVGNVDYLRPGAQYQVCASAADTGGNPPSGMNTMNANVAVTGNVITTGATSDARSGASFPCESTLYT